MLFFQIIGFIILVIIALLFTGFVAFEMSPTGNKLNIILNWIFNQGIQNLIWLIILLIPIIIILDGIITMYVEEHQKGVVDDLGPFKYVGLTLTQLPFVFWFGCYGPGRETINDLSTGLAASITAWTAGISLGIIILHYARAHFSKTESKADRKRRLEEEERERRASEAAHRRDASYAAERAARMAKLR